MEIATLPTRDAMLTQHQLWPCVCPSIRPSAPLSVTSWSYIKVAVQIQLVFGAEAFFDLSDREL